VTGRRTATSLGLTLLLVLTLCSSASASRAFRDGVVGLDAQTAAVGRGGVLLSVSDPGLLVPGSRVLAGTPDTAAELAAERAWLAAGTVPVVAELGDTTLVRDALLDLRTLALPSGVPVASWSPPWRYVWPRDSSLAAAALARTGHHADAGAVLDFLQRVQPASGVFAARYLPDGSGVPDDRPAQLDGVGWALWALAAVVKARPAAERPPLLARYRTLLDRSAAAAQASVDNPRSLPAASSDYWERRERRLTLATAALVQAGLIAAGWLYTEAGDPRAADVRAAADRVTVAIPRAFGPDGYPRHLGGKASSVDLGVVFLLPPFGSDPRPDVVAAWRSAPQRMLRPAGGLAPGGSWPDGISWTTATSSYALAAASLGHREAALGWLRWLDDHRTAAGSVPEKVLADGRPAAVAPLAWPAAVVVLSAATLAG
jgi:glucoamylase